MSNTITAFFKGRVGVAEAVYQNDYGIVMNFDSIELPAHFDCYFSITGEDEAIPGIGADRQVVIPNSCLSKSGTVTLHIPIHTGANDSEVEYVVYFKVIGRARPVDDGTPVQMTAIEQALALLQNPIGNIEQIVNEALAFTGDTFEQMQAALDADQAAYQQTMNSRQTQVESNFSNLNAQFQAAVSAITVDSEVQNVRVGADNATYASAGEAVREQIRSIYKATGNAFRGYTKNKYIPLGGATTDVTNPQTTSNAVECCVTPCTEGEEFYITALGAGNMTRAWGFVASDGTILKVAPNDESLVFENFRLVAPTNAVYLVSNNYFGSSDNPGVDGQIVKNELIRTSVERLLNAAFTESIDLLNETYWLNGNIDSGGTFCPNAGYFSTPFLNASSMDRTVNIITGGNAVFIFEYDVNQLHINTDPDTGGKKFVMDSSFSLQENTAFIRVCIRKEPIDTSATKSITANSKVYTKESIAKSTQEYLNSSKLQNEMRYIADSKVIKDGYWGEVNATNGEIIGAADNWRYSELIDVSGLDSFYAITPTFTSDNVGGFAFYDSSYQYVWGIKGRVTGTASYEERLITIPVEHRSSIKYARFAMRATEKDNFKAWKNRFDELEDQIEDTAVDVAGMQMFKKIGVIGDSISCGWCLDKNGNRSRRNLDISWPQQMARRLGCVAYNLGASGVDPIEWFQTDYEFYEYCLPQYQSVGECDLYIIGLGLNYGTLGTIADVNQSDYTQNGATFYGQYARIIQMINAEHPNSIVMCLTEPTSAISAYDQAVRDICGLSYINAELVDLENDYFDLFNTSEIIAEHQPDGLHFTPYGYSLLAEATITALDDYISKNSTHFKYVGVAIV